jgi:transcriptional regulator with XRE-family HTH domain
MNTAALLRRARARSGLTLRQLAERAATSHATLSAYESGRVHPSTETMQRIIRAAGFGLSVELLPLVGHARGDRGDELLQVLDLAAQFPARHARRLRYPRFGPQ